MQIALTHNDFIDTIEIRITHIDDVLLDDPIEIVSESDSDAGSVTISAKNIPFSVNNSTAGINCAEQFVTRVLDAVIKEVEDTAEGSLVLHL